MTRQRSSTNALYLIIGLEKGRIPMNTRSIIHEG